MRVAAILPSGGGLTWGCEPVVLLVAWQAADEVEVEVEVDESEVVGVDDVEIFSAKAGAATPRQKLAIAGKIFIVGPFVYRCVEVLAPRDEKCRTDMMVVGLMT